MFPIPLTFRAYHLSSSQKNNSDPSTAPWNEVAYVPDAKPRHTERVEVILQPIFTSKTDECKHQTSAPVALSPENEPPVPTVPEPARTRCRWESVGG
jgi:hypothetical protein